MSIIEPAPQHLELATADCRTDGHDQSERLITTGVGATTAASGHSARARNALQALLIEAQTNNNQQAINDLTTQLLENQAGRVTMMQSTS
jgi:hypothetical protein